MAIKNTEKYQRLATHARACLYVRILHRLASPLQRTAADSEAKMLESTIKLLHFDLCSLSQKGKILCALFHTMDSKASCSRSYRSSQLCAEQTGSAFTAVLSLG